MTAINNNGKSSWGLDLLHAKSLPSHRGKSPEDSKWYDQIMSIIGIPCQPEWQKMFILLRIEIWRFVRFGHIRRIGNNSSYYVQLWNNILCLIKRKINFCSNKFVAQKILWHSVYQWNPSPGIRHSYVRRTFMSLRENEKIVINRRWKIITLASWDGCFILLALATFSSAHLYKGS